MPTKGRQPTEAQLVAENHLLRHTLAGYEAYAKKIHQISTAMQTLHSPFPPAADGVRANNTPSTSIRVTENGCRRIIARLETMLDNRPEVYQGTSRAVFLAALPSITPQGVQRALAALHYREQEVIAAQVSLYEDDYQPRSYAQIATSLGITAGRVSQIARVAWDRLLHPTCLRLLINMTPQGEEAAT